MFDSLARPLQLAWFLLGLAWAGLLYELFQLWGVSPDYSDRYIIYAGSLWLIWRNAESFVKIPVRPSNWGLVGLLPAALALPPGWFMMPQIHLNSTLFLWLTCANCLATLSLAVVSWGWRPARLLLFPVLFVLFALPIPGQPYVILRRELQELSTGLAAKALRALGYAVQRNGFELYLPGGQLEVVEACSGIRSMTALTAMAAFIAYYRCLGLLRGLGLVAFSVPTVAVCNAGRIAATGVLQENFGQSAIQGIYHEVLGACAVLFGLSLIVAFSGIFAVPKAEGAPLPAGAPAAGGAWRGPFALAVLLLAVASSGYLFWMGAARIFVQEGEAPLEQVAMELGSAGGPRGYWKGRDVPVDPEVAEALGCTKILCRTYENEVGRSVQAWTMYWPAHSLVLRNHHPETCLPHRGFQSVAREQRQVGWRESSRLTLTEQLFRREGHDQLLHYWTQDGRRFLSKDEEFGDFGLSMPAWLLKLARDGSRQDRTPRLRVLIGTESTGRPDAARRTLAGFTALYAAELYRLCPWAEPEEARDETADPPR